MITINIIYKWAKKTEIRTPYFAFANLGVYAYVYVFVCNMLEIQYFESLQTRLGMNGNNVPKHTFHNALATFYTN